MSNLTYDHIVICGVSGAGKSTVARKLAELVQGDYFDADDFHSDDAKTKMASGEPLSDDDRAPWLERLSEFLAIADRPVVLACSALKQSYRVTLKASSNIGFIVLTLSPSVASKRVNQRGDAHFMPVTLVESQFQALEISEDCKTVDAEQSIDTVVNNCLSLVCKRV